MDEKKITPKGSFNWRDFFHDCRRLLILLGITGVYLLLSDPVNRIIIDSVVVGVFLAGSTHFVRRILFNRIHLQEVAQKATETPVGAAIVFAAMVAFLCVVMMVPLMVLG